MEKHWNNLVAVATTREACIAIEALQARMTMLEEVICEAAQHDSWRCREYQECHCGLDDATDKAGLPRIPYPPKH